MSKPAEDLYIATDDKGDTIIGTQQVIPWAALDSTLAERYPDLFPAPEAPAEDAVAGAEVS